MEIKISEISLIKKLIMDKMDKIYKCTKVTKNGLQYAVSSNYLYSMTISLEHFSHLRTFYALII